MKGLRRAVPRLRTRAFTVHHGDGSCTRVMQQQKQCTSRVVVTARVSVAGVDPDDLARLTVSELEEIIAALREFADGYEIISREKAAGPAGKPRRPPAERA